MLTVAVFSQSLIRHPAKTRGQNHGADLQLFLFRLLLEINRMAATDRHADLAGALREMQTSGRINKIGGGNRLRIINVNGASKIQALIKTVSQMTGAVTGAQAAGRTFVCVNITGPQVNIGRKGTRFSFQANKIRIA